MIVINCFFFVIFNAFYAMQDEAFISSVCALFSLTLPFLLWFSGWIILGKTDSSDVV